MSSFFFGFLVFFCRLGLFLQGIDHICPYRPRPLSRSFLIADRNHACRRHCATGHSVSCQLLCVRRLYSCFSYFCSMPFYHFLSSLTVFASLQFITIRRLPSLYIAYYVIRGIRKYRLFWRLSYFLLFVNPFLRKIDAFVLLDMFS